MPSSRLACLALAAIVAAPAAAAEVDRRTANDGNVVLENVPEVPPELSRRIARYLETRSAVFRDWTPDGSGLYVTTRFGRTSQIHRVAMPGGARTQLTFEDEPVGGVVRRPGSAELLFSMDEGGSEFDQLFLFDPAAGEHRRLTDGASRNGAALWSRDGARLAFQSTRRDGRSNDVWVMDPGDPESARLVLESPDGTWWGPSDWSADGSRLLIANYVSITESSVHELELASGESRPVAGGGETPASFLGVDPVYDRAGTAVYVATDADGDFQRLARIDLATGERILLTPKIPWDVIAFEMGPERRRAAFVTNEGGLSRLYLMELDTHRYAAVEGLPVGLFSSLEFSPDGRRLGLTIRGSQTPGDAFSLALGEDPLAHGELVRWTASEVGGLDTTRFAVPELVHYPTFDTVPGADGEGSEAPRRIPAFVYTPPGDGPHPVVVYLHGGPESQFRPSFRPWVQMWIDVLGAAVVAPNVRGSSGYGRDYVSLDNGFRREDSVRDVGALLDWIETRSDLDASRVAVYGGSYGGYMVLASLVHYSDRLQAGVDIVGISNFVTFLENTQDYRRDLRRVEYGDERDPAMRAHLEKISPSRQAAKITAPLLVAQGQNDPRVPVTESEQIVREVRDAGYDVWYMNALNEGHGFDKKENSDLYREIVVMFLQKHLVGAVAEAAP